MDSKFNLTGYWNVLTGLKTFLCWVYDCIVKFNCIHKSVNIYSKILLPMAHYVVPGADTVLQSICVSVMYRIK
jgi:hypothetical protein